MGPQLGNCRGNAQRKLITSGTHAGSQNNVGVRKVYFFIVSCQKVSLFIIDGHKVCLFTMDGHKVCLFNMGYQDAVIEQRRQRKPTQKRRR